MIEGGYDPRLASEALDEPHLLGQPRHQDLESCDLFRLLVDRLVDLGHPAAPQSLDDAVPADSLSDESSCHSFRQTILPLRPVRDIGNFVPACHRCPIRASAT